MPEIVKPHRPDYLAGYNESRHNLSGIVKRELKDAMAQEETDYNNGYIAALEWFLRVL